MHIQEAFAILKKEYRTHSAAARALGISVPYYRDIRNGRSIPGNTTRSLVLLKAQQIGGEIGTDKFCSGNMPKRDSDLLALCLIVLAYGSDLQKQALISLSSRLSENSTSTTEGEES